MFFGSKTCKMKKISSKKNEYAVVVVHELTIFVGFLTQKTLLKNDLYKWNY